jgi:hypothetical protein
MDLFLDAFTPVALVAAVLGGLFVGYFVYGYMVEVAMKQTPMGADYKSPIKSARGLAAMSFIFGIPFVCGFYVPQLFAAYADGDPFWPRLAGRGVIALIYLFFYSLGAARKIRTLIA